jgi:hypothetical protein
LGEDTWNPLFSPFLFGFITSNHKEWIKALPEMLLTGGAEVHLQIVVRPAGTSPVMPDKYQSKCYIFPLIDSKGNSYLEHPNKSQHQQKKQRGATMNPDGQCQTSKTVWKDNVPNRK